MPIPIITPTPEQNENLLQFAFGFLGAIVRLAFRYDKRMGVGKALVTIVAGVACSYLIPPVFSFWLPIRSPQTQYLMGFICGMTGMKLCEVLITTVDRDAPKVASRYARKKANELLGEDDAEPKGDEHP